MWNGAADALNASPAMIIAMPATKSESSAPVAVRIALKPSCTCPPADVCGADCCQNGQACCGGECVDPRRNLPIAIVWGTILVIAIYVITNLAYFRVLTPAEVALYPAVGSEAIGRLLGDMGRQGLAVLVSISTFGTVNGAILTGPRVTQAMAGDGLLWKPLAKLHPRRGSPSFALWVQAVLSCVWLAVAGGFEDVSGWFVTTSWLFYGLAIAAVFIQRRRERAGEVAAATYRAPLYPITAWLFILVTVGLIVSDLTASGWRAAAGVGIAFLGFPVYWIWKGRARRVAS